MENISKYLKDGKMEIPTETVLQWVVNALFVGLIAGVLVGAVLLYRGVIE
jgi:hypothetical protein